jgi:bifunctional N-acetylglucosamine-1-phosphate-uridyltransferase/glucosamine-1-phosphate-acetyltransferase GlmU-like protein
LSPGDTYGYDVGITQAYVEIDVEVKADVEVEAEVEVEGEVEVEDGSNVEVKVEVIRVFVVDETVLETVVEMQV